MTMDNHAARKAAVYEAALQLIARGVSPAAMTIQQLADTAGIGKGTVYGYFSSKEEILQGLAEYCFARENERIRVLFADCRTLAGLEERAVAYLQDIAVNRMGDYKMIAQALGTPGKCESVPACVDELRDIMRTLLIRLQAAGEIDPAVSLEYCCTAIFSAVVGGLIGLCFTAECGIQSGLPENLKCCCIGHYKCSNKKQPVSDSAHGLLCAYFTAAYSPARGLCGRGRGWQAPDCPACSAGRGRSPQRGRPA